jgi:hypothetical protein
METTKIRVKMGENEFEAEGPTNTVESQFEAFKEMVASMPPQLFSRENRHPNNNHKNQGYEDSIPHIPIEKILHVAGRVVSLTALPATVEDSALLLLLGHKDLRNNPAVTGQELGDGLAQSGRPVPRVDRVMEKAMAGALVLKSGVKRATRYRLTNQGMVKALNIARDLIATLP